MPWCLTRLWSFRHNSFPLEGKPYAIVSSGAFQIPEEAVEAVKGRMNAYKALFVGSVEYKFRGNHNKYVEILKRVLETNAWSGFGYLSAEVDMKKIKG